MQIFAYTKNLVKPKKIFQRKSREGGEEVRAIFSDESTFVLKLFWNRPDIVLQLHKLLIDQYIISVKAWGESGPQLIAAKALAWNQPKCRANLEWGLLSPWTNQNAGIFGKDRVL